jgi:hypothetical protein
MNDTVKILKDFIVFPLYDEIRLIDITCSSKQPNAKAKKFYVSRKDKIDDKFLLFVKNRNASEVDVSKLK